MNTYWLGYIKEEFATAPPPGFFEIYERCSKVLWSLDERVYHLQDEWILGGNVSPRRCCFCGKTSSDGATFKNVSHAIPEALGNKRVISNEECDGCNSGYSNYEEQLARTLCIERVFAGARGKNGLASIGEDKNITARRGQHGVEVAFKIDPSTQPLKELGPNRIQITFDEAVDARPALAIRSMLRSAWMMLDAATRHRAPTILQVAQEALNTPIEYLAVFSPGAQTAVGTARVHVRRDSVTNTWPEAIVSLSLGNTTLVWRAPVQGQYAPSPMPPIEALDEDIAPRVTRYRTESADAQLKSSSTFDVNYTSKSEAQQDPTPVRELRRHPIEDIKKSIPVSLSVGTDAGRSPWIEAVRQVKKISPDLSTYSLLTIFSQKSGLRLQIRQKDATGGVFMDVDFRGEGLPLGEAEKAVAFLSRLVEAVDGHSLFLKNGDSEVRLPLTAQSVDDETAKKMKAVGARVEELVALSAALGVEMRVPTRSDDPVDLLSVLATTVTRRQAVRLRQEHTVEIAVPKEEYDELCKVQGESRFLIGECLPEFRHAPELTPELVGPLVVFAPLEETARQLRAAFIREVDGTVSLRLNVSSLLYVFRKHVASSDKSAPPPYPSGRPRS